MANVLKWLNTQKEHGGMFVGDNGEIYSKEKLENIIKKAYIKGISKGEIDLTTSYEMYSKDVKKEYKNMDYIIGVFHRSNESTDSVSENEAVETNK